MKIIILGYSGAGKSSLATNLGSIYKIPVLHLDAVHYNPNWVPKTREEENQIVAEFLDNNESYVIDGTYTKVMFERRMQEADLIILMLFNRFSCYFRARKRAKIYRNKVRPDIAEGCGEKFDKSYQMYLLFSTHSKRKRKFFKDIWLNNQERTVVLKNQRQLNRYLEGVKKDGISS